MIMKNKFLMVLSSFLMLVAFIYLGASVIFVPSFFQGFSYPGLSNTFCQDLDLNHSFYIDRLVCKNDKKKSKFIWIFLDGLAYDQLDLLKKRKEYKIPNLFKITTDQYRQSGSLHETYLTGKFSRNFPAQEIKIDHIFNQAAQAKIPMYYRGTNFPLYFLLGEKESKIVKSFEIGRSEPFPFTNMCKNHPFVNINLNHEEFPQAINEDGDVTVSVPEFYQLINNKFPSESVIDNYALNSCLEQAGLKNDKNEFSNSLIFYTMIVDHLNHSFHKFYANTLSNTYSIEKDLLAFVDWIEAHPEYALIISSDHGGQSYNDEDSMCIHGCVNPGNEAIFSIFTRELMEQENSKSPSHEEYGGIEDIAPTVAQILENVNIPLEAKGFPLFFNKDPLSNLISLRSKEIQLIQYVKAFLHRGDSTNMLQRILDNFNSSEFSFTLNNFTFNSNLEKIENVEEFISKYQKFLLKQQNIINITTKSLGRAASAKLFIFLVFIIIIMKFYSIFKVLHHKTASSLLPSSRNIILKGFYLILCIFFTDIIISFYNPFDLVVYFTYSHLSFFLLIFFLVIIMKYIISKEETIIHDPKVLKEINFLIITAFISFVIVFVTYYYDLFLNVKKFFRIYETGKALDMFNYPIFILFLFYEARKFKDYYFDLKGRIRLDVFLMAYFLMTTCMMINFDFSFPKHFTNQTFYLKNLVRTIYCLNLLLLCLSFKSFYAKASNGQFKRTGMLFSLIKYSLILYINFLSDEAERLYMYIIILPLFQFFSYNYKRYDHMVIKLICAACLIVIPDVIYTLNKGTFTFDVSIKVCTKSIGDYPDQTPIFTGVLMGSHKLRLFILLAGFIIENLNMHSVNNTINLVINKILDKNAFCFRILLELQMCAIIFSYFYYLFKDYEELYLKIFIWAGTKAITILIVDLVVLLNYLLHVRKAEILSNVFKQVSQRKLDTNYEDTKL